MDVRVQTLGEEIANSVSHGVGLVAAIAPCRVAVLAIGRAMTEADRGAVLGWLVAQPEVVFIHIERRLSRRVSIGCAGPTPAIELVQEVGHGRA